MSSDLMMWIVGLPVVVIGGFFILWPFLVILAMVVQFVFTVISEITVWIDGKLYARYHNRYFKSLRA